MTSYYDYNESKYFSDPENVLKEIRAARAGFTKDRTFEEFDSLIHGLGVMYMNCPDNMEHLVLATLQEAQKRQLYSIMGSR